MQAPTSKAPVDATATTAQRTARGETSARSQSLARNWALVTLRGLVAVAFALVAFLWPGATIASLVLLFCAYMLADGVVAAASGVRAARKHERWGWFVLEGLIDVAAAILAFVWPGITVLVFVLLVAVWALVSGVLMLMAAFRLNTSHGRGWLVLAGIVSLLWGLLLTVCAGSRCHCDDLVARRIRAFIRGCDARALVALAPRAASHSAIRAGTAPASAQRLTHLASVLRAGRAGASVCIA